MRPRRKRITKHPTKRFAFARKHVGQSIARLTVLSVHRSKDKGIQAKCRCKCGKRVTVLFRKLIVGEKVSCGCAQIEFVTNLNKTHGLTKTKEHSIWNGMIQRCTNAKRHSFKHYGGRGIGVCDRWMRFENFLEDMGNCPTGKTLGRIDNNSGYSPDNCRWETKREQCNNTRTNKRISYEGETLTIAQWSRRLNLNRFTLYHRARKGVMPPELFTRKDQKWT